MSVATLSSPAIATVADVLAIDRKLQEYFTAGTRLDWYFDLHSRTVTVYTAPDEFAILDETSTLDGAPFFPASA
jgi:hypothetical protein